MEAARNATPAELDAVREAVADMQHRQRQGQSVEQADRDFHLAIAAATHNSALIAVVRQLWDQGRGAIWKRVEHHFQTPELLADVLRDHRAILEALESRDARRGRAAMRRHLENVDAEFSRGWEELKSRESALASTATEAQARPAARGRRVRAR